MNNLKQQIDHHITKDDRSMPDYFKMAKLEHDTFWEMVKWLGYSDQTIKDWLMEHYENDCIEGDLSGYYDFFCEDHYEQIEVKYASEV